MSIFGALGDSSILPSWYPTFSTNRLTELVFHLKYSHMPWT